MLTQQVTIQYNNPAKPGKKTGSIKTTTGEYFDVWPDKLHLFPQGSTLIIEYQTREWQGKTYKTAVGVVGDTPAAKAAQTKQHNTAAPLAHMNMSRDEHIFVCGALNASIKAGQLSWSDDNLVTAINSFRTAYRSTFGADGDAI